VRLSRAERLLLTVGAACLCLLAWASTAAADNYRYEIVPADQAAAKSALITLSDFTERLRKGWTGGPIKLSRTPPDYSVCPLFAPKHADLVLTGNAASTLTWRLNGGIGALITTSSLVFRTLDMQEKHWLREFETPGADACLRAQNAKNLEKVGRIVAFRRLVFPTTGSHTVAYRYTFRYHGGNKVVNDMIAFSRGRVFCIVEVTTGDGPGAAAALLNWDKNLVGLLDRRLRGR
jgi:hypothetical protein